MKHNEQIINMNDTPTPTPRTDEVASREGSWDTKALRMGHFARKLERELTAAREGLAEAKQQISGAREQDIIAIQDMFSKVCELAEQRDRLAEALRECRDDSIELLGERDSWQLENRGDYQKRYQETRDNVTRADAALQSLTTNKLI